MVSADGARIAFDLPPEVRLELARRLIQNVVVPDSLAEALTDGTRRIEDIATGQVKGLSDEEYRAAIQ
jgi:hypothetical protein